MGKENEIKPLKQDTAMCRVSIRGKVPKEQLYDLLDYIEEMKLRGFTFEKHDRIDLLNGNVKIDYVLVKSNRITTN